MVLGGFGPAQIAAGDGHDAIVGHDGEATFVAGILAAIWSLDTTDVINEGGWAGNDVIVAGKGNDVVIGGFGADQITTGTGEDAIVGGNGYALITPTGVTSLVFTTAPYATGGGNTIQGRAVGTGKGEHALIIGGAGSNNINGGASDDIILGGYGKIAGALNPDGSELLNSDGSWHRDVVTEEVGTITGTVELDSAGNALQPSLASSLLNADVVLLAGAYDSTGAKIINSDDNAWQTEALLVRLLSAAGSTIYGGSGNDVIIGANGNNTITGGSGNDTIFGNGASNTLSTETDMPHIVDGFVITAEAGVSLPTNGQLVTPAINLLPSALTPSAPQIELGPSTDAGSLRTMAQSGDLTGQNGSTLRVYASLVPDLIHNQNALPGSNTIVGGSGNDVIFGNYGVLEALPTTGIAPIDAQLQGLSVSMLGMLDGFSALSTGQDALDIATGHPTPFTISAGNNTITGGSGNDTIFGSSGEYLVPGTLPMSSGSSSSSALALDSYLLDMQQVVGDMSFVTHEAGEQVITTFATDTGFSGSDTGALGPATHLLDIGNNTITGGSGSDLIVGGNGFVVMPGVATPAAAGTSFDANALQQQDLSAGRAALAAALRRRPPDHRRQQWRRCPVALQPVHRVPDLHGQRPDHRRQRG